MFYATLIKEAHNDFYSNDLSTNYYIGKIDGSFFDVSEKNAIIKNNKRVSSEIINTSLLGKQVTSPFVFSDTSQPGQYSVGRSSLLKNNIYEGRLPKTENEIIISDSFQFRVGKTYVIGSQITGTIQLDDECSRDELIQVSREKMYTIVGILIYNPALPAHEYDVFVNDTFLYDQDDNIKYQEYYDTSQKFLNNNALELKVKTSLP